MGYKNLTIFMLSSHRATKTVTLKHFPRKVLDSVVLNVQQAEAADYLPLAQQYGITMMVCPPDINYIGEQRQWCIDHCATPYCCFVDDDVLFSHRENGNGRLVNSYEEQIQEMFDTVYADLEKGIPLIGISNRFGNGFVKEDYVDAGYRIMRLYFFSVDVFRKLGVTLAPYKDFVMEDFHLTLSFLENGYMSRVYYKYSQDDRYGSNGDGGCSTFRNDAVMRKAVLYLAENHPDVVHLVTKHSKSKWKGMPTRTDARIDWQKAYRPKSAPRSFFNKRG